MYPYSYKFRSNYRGRRKKRKIIIIIIAVILVILAAAAFFLYKKGFFAGKDDIKADDTMASLTETDGEDETREEMIISSSLPPPVKVKGIYVTGWSAGSAGKLDHFIELCDATEINALVIDIKDDRGQITFQSDIAPGSAAITNIIRNPAEMVSRLKEHDIYAIAKIVCFKDPIWSSENPELAIKDKQGNSWKDNNGNTWLNPYETKTWDYLVKVAREAAKLGFDEVQFDYVRFPTDGKIGEIDYGDIAEDKPKMIVIGEFLEYAREELKNDGIYISADVFGIIAVSQVDSMTIGQDLETVAQCVDYICPMIYPSHYANKRQNGVGQNINGILFEAPDLKPYDVIYNTLILIKERTSYLYETAIVRPYLQDFTASYLGAGYYQVYGAKQVKEQIQAVYDAGYEEWILWNASNTYSEDAFR